MMTKEDLKAAIPNLTGRVRLTGLEGAAEVFRLGGLVEEGTVKRGDGAEVSFAVTDTNDSVNVTYTGILPDLFREGQGVVAEGVFDPSANVFKADTILAKHDENYMPKEVADALKAQGVWKEGEEGMGAAQATN